MLVLGIRIQSEYLPDETFGHEDIEVSREQAESRRLEMIKELQEDESLEGINIIDSVMMFEDMVNAYDPLSNIEDFIEY